MMTATYSPEDNKLRLYSSVRLDSDTYARVKAAGFKWAPKQGLFVAPMWTPAREDLLIELCGEVGDEDTSLVERAEERAERFEDYSSKRAQDADHAHAAVEQITSGIPLGQPILVGHHSERHARKDAERIENGMRRAVKMWETSKYWEQRAVGAIRHAKYKELPAVRARRIKGLEADLRKQQRNVQEADMWLKLWRECAKEQDAELQKGVALKLANMCWLHLPRKEGDREDFNQCPTAYDAINNSHPTLYAPRTLQEVFDAAEAHYPPYIAHVERWINHIQNRLVYERAMLADAGAAHLLDKKPRPKQLPLCNYRMPEGLDIENEWHRGEMLHYRQVEMTKAEYARIYSDWKGTRPVGHSHRVRIAIIKHERVCVFLTDSKVHERPAEKERTTPAPRERLEPRAYVAPEPTPFDAMKEQLREGGVQVVSAPQLFPTPPELAERMVEVARIESGHSILEPSAGTGSIMRALGLARVDCTGVAVEISPTLVNSLSGRFMTWKVQQADFLECNGNLGQFDRIIMNPPFEKGADIKHIQHALHMLKPGGRLVALCANGPRQNEILKPMADSWEDLPADTFKAEGTGVRAALLVINR